MADILEGAKVVEALNARIVEEVTVLKAEGVEPMLAIVRVGERKDDISYERGASKRAEKLGVAVRSIMFAADVRQEELLECIRELNADNTVHGVLIFRPLPQHLDEEALRNELAHEKDIDGITDLSLAGVFAGTQMGYAPCTPAACIEILDHFGFELKGKSVAVVGRSLVVGKPVAMMALGRHATVTICHSRTENLSEIVRQADVVIACVGRAKMIDAEYLGEDQIVIDVGINVIDDGSLVGDVDYEAVLEKVAAITPVPGGVGTVTTSVLVKHVVEAAHKSYSKEKADVGKAGGSNTSL